MSPLRKGSRCHAPALCLSQWRGWVYATFHQWDKENHQSSCNGGIFRVFRAGGFDEINRRWRNFNYSNREVLDLPVGGRNKKENTEVFAVLPSWNDEKEERFLRQKMTVMTWKMVEKIWILGKNIFGESLTKCAPGGHEKTIINRKSREPFFKYGSLRLNDLRTATCLEAYIQKRSERVGVKPPTVYGSSILSAKNDGQFCGAHITIDHASAAWFSDASFWVRPVHAREWVFRNQQEQDDKPGLSRAASDGKWWCRPAPWRYTHEYRALFLL